MGPVVEYRFGRFRLWPARRELLAGDEAVRLGGRAFDLLLALIERRERTVTRNELFDLVWPGRVVEDDNLKAQVMALRRALGPAAIATIPGRGYRFAELVEEDTPDGGRNVAPHEPQRESTADAVAPAALRTNLPVELPTLLGRDDDLAALGVLIEQYRLVCIVGPGGIGKSVLAQHLLHVRRNLYPHGVCWVELAAVAESAALPGAIAAALGVRAGHGEPLAALAAAVAPLTMLLALDNAEHLLGDVAKVCQALHAAAPGLRLVVTSQAPLKLAAERVYRVGALAVPQGALPAADALAFGAVALFVERAMAADARFALTDDNAPAAIELCRALDGLALAIELAAVRAPMLGVQRLAASMKDRLRLLTTSRNNAAPARQQTLRAALQWSHGFLDRRERVVFRRLGIVAGSAGLEFIQQVVADHEGDGELDPWAVLDALGVLVDRSLVAVLAAESHDTPRYRLLESARAYALEQLEASGELDALRQRHALVTASLFDAEYDQCFSGRVGVDNWMLRMGADLDNARDALTWTRQEDDAGTELAIAAALLRALPPSQHAERIALADRCEARIGPSVPERLRQRAWVELSCAWADTQKRRSRDAAERSLELARSLGNSPDSRFTLYFALSRSASAAAQDADPQAAMRLLAELEALEDPTWPAQRLIWGAEAALIVARVRGDATDALHRGRRLVALDRARGSRGFVALGNLIDHELAAGNPLAATSAGTALIAALEGSRDEYSLAFARLNLIAAWLAQDNCAAARSVALAAWPQAVTFELQHVGASYLALLAALEGRLEAAAQLLGYAETIYATRKEAREGNEAAAMNRARGLAVAALGEAEFSRAHAEGTTLRDAGIAPLAFGEVEDRAQS